MASWQLLAALPDGRRILFYSSTNFLFWDLDTGEKTSRSLALQPGEGGGLSKMTALADGRVLSSVRCEYSDGVHIIYSADYITLSSINEAEVCRIWKFSPTGVRGPSIVSLLPDGRQILTSSGNVIRLWDLATGKEIRELWHEGALTAMMALPDGRRALSGFADGKLQSWNLEMGGAPRTFEGHTGTVNDVAVLSGGHRAISASADWTLRLWDLEAGECLATFAGDAAITCVAIARDDLFVAGSANGAVHFLELIEPKRREAAPR